MGSSPSLWHHLLEKMMPTNTKMDVDQSTAIPKLLAPKSGTKVLIRTHFVHEPWKIVVWEEGIAIIHPED